MMKKLATFNLNEYIKIGKSTIESNVEDIMIKNYNLEIDKSKELIKLTKDKTGQIVQGMKNHETVLLTNQL